MPFKEVIDPENGYVMENKIIFQVKIRAGPLHDITDNKWLQFVPFQKCCDHCSDGKFILAVNDFHLGIVRRYL